MVDAKQYIGKRGDFCFNMNGALYNVEGVLSRINEEDETLIFESIDRAKICIADSKYDFHPGSRLEIDKRNLVAVVTEAGVMPDTTTH